ncbi:FAD-binding dehydrogenase [Nostocoides vanveenii]|uniref:FAD-binding dehydrogenase n=1 Tax=Nostocoides vanveenii TaxID=330835 RepID=A0ABN2KD25_9MICO
MDADLIVVGHGLAGLVATAEAVAAGSRVALVDQESQANLGGQAFWSFGGLFFVGSPEQRLMGIKDSVELAWQDWCGTAGFDRPEDHWPRRWARAYVEFASGEKRSWLAGIGMRWFPLVGWAERGGGRAGGHGNSVPRFHVTWGTGPGVVAPFEERVRAAIATGRVVLHDRHRVEELIIESGRVAGVRGVRLTPDAAARGVASSREPVGDFELRAGAVVVTSGGIGGNHDLVRAQWPARLGTAPARMHTGVPAYVDGSMQPVVQSAGGRLINGDRMWHYVEGIENWDPIWPGHAIRILGGPSSLWLDARGRRLPAPLWLGYDTLATLKHLRQSGFDYSWVLTNRAVAGKEFALSGSEQNPDLTGRSIPAVLRRARTEVGPALQNFLDHGVDFLQADDIATLVAKMNGLAGSTLLDATAIERLVRDRDAQLGNPFAKDAQVVALHNARAYRGDRISKRAFPPHALLDPAYGPLVAVRMHVLTRKSLGGIETDLGARVLSVTGDPVPGLYAAGEAAGFGGGGVHGYAALEGSFLGGCLFSGRAAGRAAAADT